MSPTFCPHCCHPIASHVDCIAHQTIDTMGCASCSECEGIRSTLHRFYMRWAFRPQSTRWLGFSIGRDEDDEWSFSLGLVLLNIEAALPEYRLPLDVAPQPAVVETPLDLADSERSEAALTIHPPSYLAGWNDAKAGRQYGEGRGPSEGPPSPTPSLPDAPSEELAHPLSCFVPMCAYCEALRQRDAR